MLTSSGECFAYKQIKKSVCSVELEIEKMRPCPNDYLSINVQMITSYIAISTTTYIMSWCVKQYKSKAE